MYKSKNVLVAGGNGLIGKQLVKLLEHRGASVKVVDKNLDPEMDLTDYGKCLDACYDMDYVFNLLCIKGSPKAMQERPASHLVPMLRFNTNLMEAARESGINKYLYTSSVAVYEPDEVFKEEDVWRTFPSPNDRFAGWAKRIGELQAESYEIEYGWNGISIVRPGNTYGPHDDFDSDGAMVVPSLIKKILSGEKQITLWGDGSNVRDFTHCRDIAKGMMLVMEKSPGATSPVNLGSGGGFSIKELVEVILENVDEKPEVIWDTTKPSGDKIRVMNVDRAKSLGYNPSISLEQGIKETIDWYRNEKI
jgi:GDP-L-fucose synthase